tara:strand:- start:134 stop:328 length:195 start_codon:yes stop_codon:yes gene_type:complete
MLKPGDMVEVKMLYPNEYNSKKGFLIEINPTAPSNRRCKVLISESVLAFAEYELVLLNESKGKI